MKRWLCCASVILWSISALKAQLSGEELITFRTFEKEVLSLSAGGQDRGETYVMLYFLDSCSQSSKIYKADERFMPFENWVGAVDTAGSVLPNEGRRVDKFYGGKYKVSYFHTSRAACGMWVGYYVLVSKDSLRQSLESNYLTTSRLYLEERRNYQRTDSLLKAPGTFPNEVKGLKEQKIKHLKRTDSLKKKLDTLSRQFDPMIWQEINGLWPQMVIRDSMSVDTSKKYRLLYEYTYLDQAPAAKRSSEKMVPEKPASVKKLAPVNVTWKMILQWIAECNEDNTTVNYYGYGKYVVCIAEKYSTKVSPDNKGPLLIKVRIYKKS